MGISKQFKGLNFQQVYTCSYVSAYYSKELSVLVCIAEEEYIPIEDFKSIFNRMSDLLEESPAKHLIFDKRRLTNFHQPSMEWYFSVWKPQVKVKGLTSHYKLLPDADWFAKAVEAGKDEIFRKYGTAFLEGITVEYRQSVEEIIDELQVAEV